MTTKRTCPRCGAQADGNFCGNCGASLVQRACTGCGAPLQPGARFCTQCGAAAGVGSAAPRGAATSPPPDASAPTANVAWWFAGGLLILLILVVAWPILRPQDVSAPSTNAPATGAAAVDLDAMTPREAADALFDRVLRSAAAGDSTEARQFLPMALQAYERARPLDLDGLFHLSTLERTAGEFTQARATADGGLASGPDHLLLLYAAAQAAEAAGDTDAALGYYQHLVDVYEVEMSSGNVDYESHSSMMASVHAEATAFLQRQGANR